jgi:hypothetical protein
VNAGSPSLLRINGPAKIPVVMPRVANASASDSLEVTLSVQSKRLLNELAERGIYGRNAAEVAARFIDAALERFVTAPRLNVPSVRKAATR